MCNVLSACASLGVLVYWLIFGDKTLLVLALHTKGASSAHLLIFKLGIDISVLGLELFYSADTQARGHIYSVVVGSYPRDRLGGVCLFVTRHTLWELCLPE